jgi:hypothetical protein
MRYRRFGQTNLSLSVFSLGTMRCLSSQRVFTQTVEKAIALGINHFETAQGYGRSEEYLGNALRDLKIPRKSIIITTKLAPTPEPALMIQAISQSLERLQLDYLDCLALHGINTFEHLAWVQRENGCLAPIQEAIAAGKIHHLGFSSHGSLELILAALETNLFEFINLHYYLFFQRHAAAIAIAHQKDLGIFIISPADKGGQLHKPPQRLQDLCQPLTPLALNYRFLLGDLRLTTLSLGAADAGELEIFWRENAAICDNERPLSPEELTILRRLDQQMDQALERDRCRQCYQCLPCPENITIPEILRFRNLAIAYDMTAFGQYRYRMLENAGHWFPGQKGHRCTECGDCLPRCPEKLDIPRLLLDTHHRLNGSPRRRLWEE